MATDLGKPVTTDLYTQILQDIRDNFDMIVRMQATESVTDAPIGAIAWEDANERLVIKTGPSTWESLIPNGSLFRPGFVQLDGSYTTNSNTLVPTSAALRNAYNDLNAAKAESFSDLSGAATAGQVPDLQDLSGQCTAGQIPDLQDQSGQCTAGQVPALSALSGSLGTDQINYPSTPSGHIKAGNVYRLDGSTTVTPNDYAVHSNVAEGVWETFGPSGSGATNIVDEMDNVTPDARFLLALIEVQVRATDNNIGELKVYAAAGGVTPATSEASEVVGLQSGNSASTSDRNEISCQVMIPLNTSQVFQLRYDELNVSIGTVQLTYQGFIVD